LLLQALFLARAKNQSGRQEVRETSPEPPIGPHKKINFVHWTNGVPFAKIDVQSDIEIGTPLAFPDSKVHIIAVYEQARAVNRT
jgi:hypothetical protein